MAKTAQPKKKRQKDHDIFLRGVFSLTELVLKFLNYTIPNPLKPFIDFSTLTMLPDTYVSEKLHITQSDTIYEAQLNKNALPEEVRNDPKLPNFRFCFLNEFKSSKPNQPIDFQMDGYVKRIQQYDLKNDNPPSIVIPILLYHGVLQWEQKRLYDIFSKYLPQVILDYIAYPKYIIIDIQAMSDTQIEEAIGLEELRAAFIALKHAHDENYFKHNMKEILKFVENSPTTLLYQTYLEMLVEYSQRRSGLETEEFSIIIEQEKEDLDMATAFKSIFDYRAEKAVEKAVEKGIIALIRSTKMSDAQIAEEMEVPVEVVQEIRTKYKSKEAKA